MLNVNSTIVFAIRRRDALKIHETHTNGTVTEHLVCPVVYGYRSTTGENQVFCWEKESKHGWRWITEGRLDPEYITVDEEACWSVPDGYSLRKSLVNLSPVYEALKDKSTSQ